MQQIVECVPNFSDGRRPEVYGAIADAIRSVNGVRVLDVSPDPDHNRTVITMVGAPEVVEEAAFRGIAEAQKLINLDYHSGEHPRIGATDVCPFIPVSGVTTADCKAIAYRLGERVGRELGIAVYYYGTAALRPERTLLADIRKGEYEAWKAEIGRNPDRAPDAGPAEAAPWGATVIGVRQFLIAYNVYLNTDRVEIAEAISSAIRNLSGGFRYVQAKGFLVEGQAQVSMNFQFYERSPLHRVQEAIRREAARYGTTITHAELVGLIPQQALIDAAQWYLQIDGFDEKQVLEYHLQSTPATEGTLFDFIDATAKSTPTPGGGSVAAVAGALGAALAQMVAGLTTGRKRYKDVHDAAEAIRSQADVLRKRLTDAIAEDAAAFEQVMTVMKDKLQSAETRDALLEDATIHAAEVPLRVARLSRDVARLALEIAKIGNVNAVTDGAAGVFMAQAAVRAAGLNVRINATGVKNRELVAGWLSELEALEGEVASLAELASAEAGQRGGF
ncbi:MAG: glutamate formimidoyltransferase [Anaerolineae bacterium]|nr:glutamate formimidoyltransferase [Anaerolineae bacterium]